LDTPTPGQQRGLYRADYEHGSCGIGVVARLDAIDSHETVRLALRAVARMEHRGAVGADGNSSDGSGLLTTLPDRFFRDELAARDIVPPTTTRLGVGMVFLPPEPAHSADRARSILSEELAGVGAHVLMWRQVPVDRAAVGEVARSSLPRIEQVVFGFERQARVNGDDPHERALYLARRRSEKRFAKEGAARAHICSLSTRTIVYKGLVLSTRLSQFFPDLANLGYAARAAVFHQRFSTNTFPAWNLAQPLRSIAHNGEFNTLRGNLSWLHARERAMASGILGDGLQDVLPLAQEGDSDSAAFDRLFELLVRSGRRPARVLSMLMPSAEHPRQTPDMRAMYRYQNGVVEAWDGPAALIATDGRVVVASLDRNGLRPLRYQITRGGWLCVASESGLLDLPDDEVMESDRLGPGRMLQIDLLRGGVTNDKELEAGLASEYPYQRWASKERVQPSAEVGEGVEAISAEDLRRCQLLYGWDREDIERVVMPMGETGKVPVGSMGDDSAITPLSSLRHPLTRFFRQRFAQVTNPPLDPIRERCMFSLETPLGRHANMLEDHEDSAAHVRFSSPTIDGPRFAWLTGPDSRLGGMARLDATFDPERESLEQRVERLQQKAEQAVGAETELIVLSDRGALEAGRATVPMLLAVAAVHRALVESARRLSCSIVCETGEVREDHDINCLVGYGATLVYPYLALATVRAALPDDPDGAARRYLDAADAGLLKAMSRMGVSVLGSYRGAQLFETLGLDRAFVARWFGRTPAPVSGVGPEYFEGAARENVEAARSDDALIERGRYRFRAKGEAHGFAPLTFKSLHKAVRSGDQDAYVEYSRSTTAGGASSLRELVEFKPAGKPVPLDEVEPVASIVTRFVTGAMSHGSLSREAHELMGVAMNRLGGRSNSGEGGEAGERARPYTESNGPSHYHSAWKPGAGDWGASVIKQVASGRFGVSAAYLATASEIEIKMAQGAKPGEGGQIPGFKVSEEIGQLRGAAAGTTLISPPPHHDIYSIEDLAELIHDLKAVNRRARVAVKLVSASGVGTIAAGVVKAHADVVQISGHEGGTGASPLSAMKHAGMPWELGLAEARQTLELNGLRTRVRLRVDGGMKTGRDVAIAAALGADEYGFGTVALIAAGCVMARKCHLNTCPVGVATQDPKLRAKFPGRPEHVIAFMCFVAEELRHLLASIGMRRVSDLVGRVDLLQACADAPAHFDLSEWLAPMSEPVRQREARNDRANPSGTLDDHILADCASRIDAGVPFARRYRISNRDRAVGAGIAGEIGRLHGAGGLPDGTLEFEMHGSSGQSFGAFCTSGMSLTLHGEAQDYVGKSMSGGRIVIRTNGRSGHGDRPGVVMGNTVLYGATGGELFASGRAGERFAVRNSGAIAVIEGCGEHGCEYMTGGTVVVLGTVGRNFGAGMTGGEAYVVEQVRLDRGYLCAESVEYAWLDPDSERGKRLVGLLERFTTLTGSARGLEIRDAFLGRQQRIAVVRACGTGDPVEAEACEEPAIVS